MDVTDWKAQQDIFYFAEKSFNKHIDIVIMVAGILDSSNIIDDCEQGNRDIVVIGIRQKKKKNLQ
jgi:ribosomal protein S2